MYYLCLCYIRERFYKAFETLKIIGIIADAGKKGYIRKMIWGNF